MFNRLTLYASDASWDTQHRTPNPYLLLVKKEQSPMSEANIGVGVLMVVF